MKVQCLECGKEYQLEPEEKSSDFQCTCGGELEYGKEPSAELATPFKSSSESILNDWKKQYLLLIMVFILVFLIIAFDGNNLFKI